MLSFSAEVATTLNLCFMCEQRLTKTEGNITDVYLGSLNSPCILEIFNKPFLCATLIVFRIRTKKATLEHYISSTGKIKQSSVAIVAILLALFPDRHTLKVEEKTRPGYAGTGTTDVIC